MKKKKYCHLTSEVRHVFSAYLKDGLSLRGIEDKLGRRASGLCREIKENSKDGTREGYDPGFAHMSAQFRKWDANRRNPLKSAEVMRCVLEGLAKEWSPVQISNRMKEDYPGDSRMRISHETVYQFINSDEGKGLGLIRCLRHGKPRRHKKKRNRPIDPKKQAIPDRISIDERPAIVKKKRRYGDWESDSMIGRLTRGETLSIQKERKSQVVRLRKVKNKSAKETTKAIQKNLRSFPRFLRRTITFDNGSENVTHERVNAILKTRSYFCDAYASWQKGSVENGIGLVRDYLPKKTDLTLVDEAELKRIQDELNDRPRKCLGWKTPRQVLSNYLKTLGVLLPA